jgi:hypothetical protein
MTGRRGIQLDAFRWVFNGTTFGTAESLPAAARLRVVERRVGSTDSPPFLIARMGAVFPNQLRRATLGKFAPLDGVLQR